ncbi:Methyltransferase domain-containing protein [Micromonospora pattaloongensis]|uniref:Methyltransferase domain-containing protein n=1 Tax=Micromonospora pattaloongensis TaxID=405436 RepID=A0A1H3Q9V3_9ACTN|nr:methyltransferase domain-containing protein [Micromonospora pattaloongensis]SDZ09805.1 Methyltransferase domain-containing protein [Micromonospora pattaloongensis]
MGDEPPTGSPFAQLDRLPPEVLAGLIAALDALAAQPEIQRVRRAAQTALLPLPGQRLLDAGCGAGEVARQLAALVAPTGEVVAADFSAAAVAIAALRHDGSRVRYAVGDMTALGFADATFDRVRSERVLQHLADPDAAVAELVRVTRPGGRVCLVDTDWESLTADGLPDELTAALRRHLAGGAGPQHRSMGRTLRRRLVRAGLVDVITEPITCCFTDPDDAATVLPMFDRRLPMPAGLVPDGMWEGWFAAVDAAAARGEFLAALTIWTATALRPT